MFKNPENYNKKDVKFEDWWDYVVMVYSKGFLDAPAIGFDVEAYNRGDYKWVIPSIQQVEDFRNDLGVKQQYKKLYEDGDSVSMALAAMY